MPQSREPKKRIEFITPPNSLKRKVGSGGLSDEILEKAQNLIEEQSKEFLPLADIHLSQFMQVLQLVEKRRKDEALAMEDLKNSLIQLRAGAGMFGYTLVIEMCNMLLGFLKSRTAMDKDAIEIAKAFYASMRAIAAGRIVGDGGKQGKALLIALKKACAKSTKKKRS